jgi:hypothetical protein
MKFLKVLKEYTSTLTEQDNSQGQAVAPQQQTVGVKPPKSNVVGNGNYDKPDTPASIASLGNLLKKALTMKISDGDKFKIAQLPEINERNANETISQIETIMSTYSADVDLDKIGTNSS